DTRLESRALIELVDSLANVSERGRAQLAADIAEGVVSQTGDDELAARLLRARGEALVNAGKLDAARDAYAGARVRLTRIFGPNAMETLGAVGGLARVAEDGGDPRRARALYDEVLAGLIATLGPDHPRVADTLNNMGTVAYHGGDLDAAVDFTQRAIA